MILLCGQGNANRHKSLELPLLKLTVSVQAVGLLLQLPVADNLSKGVTKKSRRKVFRNEEVCQLRVWMAGFNQIQSSGVITIRAEIAVPAQNYDIGCFRIGRQQATGLYNRRQLAERLLRQLITITTGYPGHTISPDLTNRFRLAGR